MKRIVVLVSGGGSNLQALIDGCAAGVIDAEIVGVVSDKPGAYGLMRAVGAGIDARVLSWKDARAEGMTRDAYCEQLADIVAPFSPDLVVLAGFMLILTEPFLGRFPGRIINLHPALPGMFAGTRGIERTYAAWQRGEVAHGGCMVHYAIPEVDAGETLVSAMVPILAGESLDEFEARLHRVEHRVIVLGVQIGLEGV